MIVKKLISGILVLLIAFSVILSCQKEEFATGGEIMLEFSVDTVMFDTVFATLGTTTHILKAYNRNSDKSLHIDRIYLANNTQQFRINIDGTATKSVENVEIRANDSIFIFVEATIDPNDKFIPMVVQDSIVFEIGDLHKDVDLVAWGQDMHVIRSKIYGDMVWENDKPYLVYDYVAVDTNHTLTIEQGVQVHFNRGALLYAAGQLVVNGTKEEPVVFQGARLEYMYDDVPGQWRGIVLWGADGNEHTINYAEIKNATIGLEIDSISNSGNSLFLSNSIIQHHSLFGLYGFGSGIVATNCVFADCGIHSAYMLGGGNYQFYNCTFANYWGCSGCRVRVTPTVVVANYYESADAGTIPRDLHNAYFHNCIIYGNQTSELLLLEDEGAEFNYKFEDCLIKVDANLYSEWNENLFTNVLINPADFQFEDVQHYDFSLDTLSPAKDIGSDTFIKIFPNLLQNDIRGTSRTTDDAPDLGAYEWIYIEKEEE